MEINVEKLIAVDNIDTNLYRSLCNKLAEAIFSKIGFVNEHKFFDYVYDLVMSYANEAYRSEVDTIYGQLQDILGLNIEPACDKWNRAYNVDFYIKILDKYIGLQIKPITGKALDQYQWDSMHEKSHKRFENDFGGKVFFVYSVKGEGKKKKIYNADVIDKIKAEIERLRQ